MVTHKRRSSIRRPDHNVDSKLNQLPIEASALTLGRQAVSDCKHSRPVKAKLQLTGAGRSARSVACIATFGLCSRVAKSDRCTAVNPQSDPCETEVILQRNQVAPMRCGTHIVDVPCREPAVAPIELNDGALLRYCLVLFDKTRMVPLLFEV